MRYEDSLKLALVQMPVETLAIEDNLQRGAALTAQAARQGAELVMLPELWTTGLHWAKNASIAHAQKPVHERVASLARQHGVWLGGTLLASSPSGDAINTFMLFSPDGELRASYAKTHLFSLTGEDQYFEAGSRVVCTGTPWGAIGLAICYDVRFPEMWRVLAVGGARLILCPAAIPEPRQEQWRTLLRARAIENQCFVAGVNQTGVQQIPGGDAFRYFGGSLLVNTTGAILAEGGADEAMLLAAIDLSESDRLRTAWPVLKDRRPELYGT